MKYLIVVAHPDDEVLGAGASISRWTKNGDIVDVAMMCAEAKARAFRPDDNELEDDTNASTKYLGVDRIFEATFPNIEMNTVPHLRLEVLSKRVSRILSLRIIPLIRTMIICRLPWLVRKLSVCSNVGPR